MVREASPEDVRAHEEKHAPPDAAEAARIAAATGDETDGGLSDLTPEGTAVTLRGERFIITEWLAGQLLAISADVAEFGIAFQGVGKEDFSLVLAIITSRLDIVLKVVATTIERDIAFVERCKATELLDVVLAIYHENESFFRRIFALLPATSPAQPGAAGAGAEPAAEATRSEGDQASEAPMIGST